ncbi:hypothetical protein KCU61_g659, partial [Aureobasidium melanogenum]
MIDWFLGFTQCTLISSTLFENTISFVLVQSHTPIRIYDVVGSVRLVGRDRHILKLCLSVGKEDVGDSGKDDTRGNMLPTNVWRSRIAILHVDLSQV